jgi:hypothetical protein
MPRPPILGAMAAARLHLATLVAAAPLLAPAGATAASPGADADLCKLPQPGKVVGKKVPRVKALLAGKGFDRSRQVHLPDEGVKHGRVIRLESTGLDNTARCGSRVTIFVAI